MKYNVVAIVPMRHSSERVKGKNYRDFAGKPLYQRVIDTLLDCPKIDKVVIDTDSPIIIEQCEKLYPTVLILERPEHLRDGNIPMNNVLLNTCNTIDSNFYLQTHSTNPLLSSKTISEALDKFLENYPV